MFNIPEFDTPVVTNIAGKNDKLISEVARLYFKDGMMIADLTYGTGNFWNEINTNKYKMFYSDIEPTNPFVEKMDFRKTHYEDSMFDVVVLDPPYMHNGYKIKYKDEVWKNSKKEEFGTKPLHVLYMDGMKEAYRILKNGGLLLLKCADQVGGSINIFDHITYYLYATMLDFYAEDLFILMNSNHPMMRHNYQYHARKNHSYLWVLRKDINTKKVARYNSQTID